MGLEKNIVTAGQRELTKSGAWWVNVKGAGRNGIPDTLACYRGHFIAIEWKAPKGSTTKLQTHELAKVRVAGGTAIVARHIDDLRQVLDHLDRRPVPE